MREHVVEYARATIRHHSKSFALAAGLLPASVAADAVVLYAFCRHADDAIDLTPRREHAKELARIATELDTIYGNHEVRDASEGHARLLGEIRDVAERRRIPRVYFDEFVAGLASDAAEEHHASWTDLRRYCYRVAGTIGLMMCHVMGVRRGDALVHAAHLGIAMQLTNVARDVRDDWERGRLYLPDEILARHGAGGLARKLGEPFPTADRAAVAAATADLLDAADAYYRSGDRGMSALSLRSALAVRTARSVYSRIGDVIRARRCDPLAERAVVSKAAKLAAVSRAALATVASIRLDTPPGVPEACPVDASRLPLPGGMAS